MTSHLPLIPSESNQKLYWLQALRGVAALMVMFFHMAPHWALAPLLHNFTGIMRFGFAGVDVFFMLSGFVVYMSAQNVDSMSGVLQFIKRRALRIYLGYWPVLLVTAVGSAWILNAQLPTAKHMVGSILLLYPSLFDNWLTTAWSLTYELYFYSWIAGIVLLPARYRLQAVVLVIMGLALWNTLWLMTQPQNVYGGGQPLRFLLTGYGVEFLTGAVLAELYKNQKDRWPRPSIMLPLCVSLVCMGLALGTTSHFFDRVEIMRAGSFGVFALGLFLMTLTLQIHQFRAPKWLAMTGDASFSLYLLHTFLLSLAGLFRFNHLQGNTMLILLFSVLLPVGITLMSVAWFKSIEYPLMRRVLHK